MDEGKKDIAPEDNSDLQEINRVYGPVEAELIKNFLESQGIPCLVRGLTAGFIYPFSVDGMAEFKVFICRNDVEKARELLDNKFPENKS
jgi:hypothetical protein